MIKIPKTRDLFDISHSIAKDLLSAFEYPYEAIPKIKECLLKLIEGLDESYKEIANGVFVAEDALLWNGATITGPTIIGHRAEIRPGAFIRGNVIVGCGALIGNSTEAKNSIIFDEATAMLDPNGRKDVLRTMELLNREHGMTIVMVSSELQELRSVSDRIAIVSEGKLVDILSPNASDADFGLAMSGIKPSEHTEKGDGEE